MDFRTRLQLAEALGSHNRWFCSEAYGQEITDKDTLIIYYIKSGGAEDFAKRYSQAMGGQNRWYCSEFHRHDIRDPRILWEYYISHCPTGAATKDRQRDGVDALSELSIAC